MERARRAQVEALTKAVQEACGGSVEIAFVDQGYTGDAPAEAAQSNGIELQVVKLPEARLRVCAAAAALGH